MSQSILKDPALSLSPVQKYVIQSASLLVGCLGFALSVVAALVNAFLLLLPRRSPQHDTAAVLRHASSRRKVRRTQITPAPSSPPTLPRIDSASTIRPTSVNHSLDESSQVRYFPTQETVPSPHNDYFPPMDPPPKSEAPHDTSAIPSVSVTPPVERHSCDSTTVTKMHVKRCKSVSNGSSDGPLRESRSTSFFKSRGSLRKMSSSPSDISGKPSVSPPPLSPPHERKLLRKQSTNVRARTQPYEAPYFFPVPGSKAASNPLPPRPTPARSQTVPPRHRNPRPPSTGVSP